MQTGRFFFLEEGSKPHEGLTTFRYLPVSRKHPGNTSDSEQPCNGDDYLIVYPIYLTVSHSSIDFYYHGPEPTDSEQQKKHARVVNISILHLPITRKESIVNELTICLQNCYNDGYPLPDCFSVDIKNKKRPAFWDLDVFLSEEELESLLCSKGKDVKPENYVFFRKLVLDFLYDFIHGRIFHNIPHFEQVRTKLYENYYFKSIIAKATYYYDRTYFSLSLEENSGCDVFARYLDVSERRWLNIIRQEQSGDHFYIENSWFKPAEEEYRLVLFQTQNTENPFNRRIWRDSLSRSQEKSADENFHILQESARWFMHRYSLIGGIRVVLEAQYQKIPLLIVAVVFCFLIMPIVQYWQMDPVILKTPSLKIISILTYIILGTPVFAFLCMILLYKMVLPLIGLFLPRLLMAICSGWIAICTSMDLLEIQFDYTWKYFYLSCFLIIPVLLFMIIEIRNIAGDVHKIRLTARVLVILCVGFWMSLIVGLFFTELIGRKLLIRSEFLHEYVQDALKSPERLDDFDKVGLGKLLLGSLELNETFDNDEFNLTATSGDSFINALLPLSCKDPISLSKLLYLYKRKGLSIEELQLLTEFNEHNTPKFSADSFILYLNYIKATEKSITTVSYSVPLKAPYSTPGIILQVFPTMLLVCSMMALFIGIFIQLIFEDKPVTEPL